MSCDEIAVSGTVSLLQEVRELYKNRVDKLQERHYDYITGWVTEKFARGRASHLRGTHTNTLLMIFPTALNIHDIRLHRITDLVD